MSLEGNSPIPREVEAPWKARSSPFPYSVACIIAL
jgi:hypothetical protein